MGKYSIEIVNEAKKELAAHYEGIGSPEPLKYELSGYWSRQINKKDRLIYKVKEETITIYIVSATGHYNDR